MKSILFAQWRLVRWSFAIFTVLGVLEPPYSATTSTRFTWLPLGVTVWPILLAASLSARLFAREAARVDSTYWRSVPISRGHWLGIRAGVMFSLLALGIAVQWIAWHSPFANWIFDWAYTPNENSMLTATRFVSGPDGVLRIAFLPPNLGLTLSASLLVVATTTYFASSFERAVAAWQAGVPGFLIAVGIMRVFDGAWWIFHPWRVWLAVALTASLCLGCAYRLQLDRGICHSNSAERILGPSDQRTSSLQLLVQLLLVAVPLVLIIGMGVDFKPTPPLSKPELRWVALGVLSIFVLPQTIREVRCLGRSAWASAAIGIARTSLVGLPFWKVLRRRSALVSCARCSKPRLASVKDCPACGAHSTKPPRPSLAERFRVPETPWGVAMCCVIGGFLLPLLGYLLPRTPAWHEWRIQSDLPGVEFARSGVTERDWFLEGRVKREGTVSGVGSGTHRGGCAIPHSSPFTAAELRDAAGESDRNLEFERGMRDTLGIPIPGELGFEVSATGSDVRISSFSTSFTEDPSTTRTVTRLALDLPQHVGRARHLIESALAERLADDEIAEAADLGEPFLTVLIREMGKRVPVRVQTHDLMTADRADDRHLLAQTFRSTLDRLLLSSRKSSNPQRGDARELLLEELVIRRARYCERASGVLGPPFDLACLYGPERELALISSSEDLAEAILDGNAFAALASGMRADAHCYEPCLSLMRIALREGDARFGEQEPWIDRVTCAAWALLAIDSARGVRDIIEALFERPLARTMADGTLTALLAYSGHPEIEERVRSLRSTVANAQGNVLAAWPWDRCFQGLRAGLRPEEYWLGW